MRPKSKSCLYKIKLTAHLKNEVCFVLGNYYLAQGLTYSMAYTQSIKENRLSLSQQVSFCCLFGDAYSWVDKEVEWIQELEKRKI